MTDKKAEEIMLHWVKNYKGNSVEYLEVLKAAINALQEKRYYDNLREQKRLVSLPCDIGTTVYKIYQFCGTGAWEISVHPIKLEDVEEIGKTVFLTREEAQNAIEERKVTNETYEDMP